VRYITTIGAQEFVVEILGDDRVILDGETLMVDFNSVAGQPVFSLLVDGQSHEAYVYPTENGWQVLLKGRSYTAWVEDELEKRLRMASGAGVSERTEIHLKAPMPGLVVSVCISEGQKVGLGDVLVVLESMKMQNELKSPRAGTVSRLRVVPGDRVEQHETMLSIL
jgi:acetyl/propionyl-CoA carboxylase alpha subunit